MDQILKQALEDTISVVEATGDFVLEQAPDVINQLLIWNAVQSGLWFVTSLVISVLAFGGAHRYLKQGQALFRKDTFRDRDKAENCYFICGVLLAVGATSGVLTALNLTWLKIAVSPKLYILEYAAQFLK